VKIATHYSLQCTLTIKTVCLGKSYKITEITAINVKAMYYTFSCLLNIALIILYTSFHTSCWSKVVTCVNTIEDRRKVIK